MEVVIEGTISLEPIWTDLKQIESLSWTVPWSLASFLVLPIRRSPFSTVFWSFEPIDFPSKTGAMCHVGLASICHFLVFNPCLKALRLI